VRRYKVFALVILLSVVVVFSGCTEERNEKIELSGIEFYATGTRGFSNKAKALEAAREIRNRGGAGFVDFDGEWFVIEKIGEGDLRFSAESVEVSLARAEDKELVDALVKSFAENVATLQSLSGKSAREVAAEALRLYNEFRVVVSNFGTIHNIVYSEIQVAANKQLLALFLLSTEKSGSSISSALEHCICSIKFAYMQLLTSLRSQ